MSINDHGILSKLASIMPFAPRAVPVTDLIDLDAGISIRQNDVSRGTGCGASSRQLMRRAGDFCVPAFVETEPTVTSALLQQSDAHHFPRT